MKKTVLIFIFLFSTIVATKAQVWTLDKCISYAMENNLSIKQGKLGVDLAALDKDQSRYAMYPNLNAQASQSHNYGLSVNPVTSSSSLVDYNSISMGANSQVTIFAGGQRRNAYKSDIQNFEAEKSNLEKNRNDIALSIINFYLNVLYNQDLVGVAKEQVNISVQQLDRATKNAEVGNITQGDLLETKAQLSRDELNLTNAQNQLDIARLNLIQLLDRDPAEKFEVERPGNVDSYLASISNYQITDVYNTAVDALPDVRLLNYRYKAAQFNLASAKGARYPSLSFSTGMNSNYADLGGISFNTQIKNNFGQFWGFTLNVPVFNSHSADINVKRAQINLASAEINTQTAKLNLSKSIAQAIADLKASEKKLESTVKTQKALDESFKYNQQKFDVGLINSVDYIISKNNLSKSAADALQAKYELIFRQKLLDFYLGKPLAF